MARVNSGVIVTIPVDLSLPFCHSHHIGLELIGPSRAGRARVGVGSRRKLLECLEVVCASAERLASERAKVNATRRRATYLGEKFFMSLLIALAGG
jgi:hypothetical protein